MLGLVARRAWTPSSCANPSLKFVAGAVCCPRRQSVCPGSQSSRPRRRWITGRQSLSSGSAGCLSQILLATASRWRSASSPTWSIGSYGGWKPHGCSRPAQGNIEADVLSGTAVTAIETGTFGWSAAVLIRSGFDHRLAAIAAVESTGAAFDSASEMRRWIAGLDPFIALDENWPTPEPRSAWLAFAERSRRRRTRRWRRLELDVKDVRWLGEAPPKGSWLRVTDADDDTIQLWSPGFDLLGEAHVRLNRHREGVLRARRKKRADRIQLRYRGPADLVPRGRPE